MARLPHADQSRLPMPRLDPRRADCARPGAAGRSRKTLDRAEGNWNPGVAELLLQVADDRAGTLSRTRSVHPVDEAEEHAAPFEGRGTHHAFGVGVLRLNGKLFLRAGCSWLTALITIED